MTEYNGPGWWPKPPSTRIVTEGTIGDCPVCKSTTLHKHNWNLLFFNIKFGKKIGCIQPKCDNYYNSVVNKRDRLLDNLGI